MALRPKCRKVPASVSVQLGEPFIVVCASYDDAGKGKDDNGSKGRQADAKGGSFMDDNRSAGGHQDYGRGMPVHVCIASCSGSLPHPAGSARFSPLSLSALPLPADRLGRWDSTHLCPSQPLHPCPSYVLAIVMMMAYHAYLLVALMDGLAEGVTAGQVALDPREVGRLRVREAASVLLSRQDLGIICGIRSSSTKVANGALVLQLYVSPAHAYILFHSSIHSFAQSLIIIVRSWSRRTWMLGSSCNASSPR